MRHAIDHPVKLPLTQRQANFLWWLLRGEIARLVQPENIRTAKQIVARLEKADDNQKEPTRG